MILSFCGVDGQHVDLYSDYYTLSVLTLIIEELCLLESGNDTFDFGFGVPVLLHVGYWRIPVIGEKYK